MNNKTLRVSEPTLEAVNKLKTKLKLDNQNDVITHLIDRDDILSYMMELKKDINKNKSDIGEMG